MVSTLSAAWNVILLVLVVICAVIVVINVRSETQARKNTQQEVSSTPPVLPDDK